MQDLFKLMLTPGWIVSVVVVGVILNVLSGYIKESIDKVFALFSKRAARASTRRAEARKALIARLRTDPSFRRQYRIHRLRDGYMGGAGMVCGMMLLMLTTTEAIHTCTSGLLARMSDPRIAAYLVLSMLLFTVALAFSQTCLYRSVMLIRSEGMPDPLHSSDAPSAEFEVEAKQQ